MMEEKKRKKEDKKRSREFREQMAAEYLDFLNTDVCLSPKSQEPCCSKDESKSSKRELPATSPENRKKHRSNKRPAKKRFRLQFEDSDHDDDVDVSICFECKQASLPSGVFRESIQWISCNKCSVWVPQVLCWHGE